MALPLIAALAKLGSLTRAASVVVGKNTKSLAGLESQILDLANVMKPVINVFASMEKLQIKALAVGTNANKFINYNTEYLKKFRGGFFENAEEMFANFEAGIRDNVEGLDQLQNRMRLSGQSTELSRKIAVRMLNYTGNNTAAVDSLSKTNLKLAFTNNMTNQSLLELVDSLDSISADRSLFGQSEQVANLAQLIGAKAGPGAEPMVQEALKFMLDADKLALSQMMGFQELSLDNLSNAQDVFFANLRKASAFKENLVGNQGGNERLKLQMLEGLGVKEGIIQMTNLLKKMENPQTVSEDLKTKEDKFYDSFENYKNEFTNFAVGANAYYIDMLEAATWASRQAQNIPETVANLLNFGAVMLGIKDKVAARGKPKTTQELLQERGNKIIADRELATRDKNNKLVEENNKKLQALIDVNTKKPTDPNMFMNQVLYQIGRTMSRNRDSEAKSLELAETTNKLLEKMAATGVTKFGGK